MTTPTIDSLATSWELFKTENDKAVATASAEQLVLSERVNTEIADILAALKTEKTEREKLEAILNRPGASQQTIESDLAVRDFFAIADGIDLESVELSDHLRESLTVYDKDFGRYLRKHTISAEMQVGQEASGGYWVTPELSTKITEFIVETSPVRTVANIETISTGSLEGEYDLQEAGTGGWVEETTTRSGDTSTPGLGGWKIPVHEQYAEPRTTQIMLDDSRRDVATWLAAKVARKFANDENTAFVNGNGVSRPRGFLTYGAGTPAATTTALYELIRQVVSGHATTLLSDGLIDLVHSLKATYRMRASFAMESTTLSAIRKLTDGQGNYLWQPDFTQERADRLLGYGINEWADMPVVAANSLSIAFADWQEAYTIVDRAGITVLRDNLTTKGKVKFYTTKRVGGDVVNFDAIVLQKVST